jgi:hypothetical protein
MKLHTTLTREQVYDALKQAKRDGLVAPNIIFAQMDYEKSRTHENGFNIQLGSYTGDRGSLLPDATNMYGKPQKRRLTRNTRDHDVHLRFAATWYEWGWFMLGVFKADPTARWGGMGMTSIGYRDVEDFHKKTDYKFA